MAEGLKVALRLAANAETSYEQADDGTRRRWNQAFFRPIFLQDDEASGAELAEPFDTLLADELVEDLETVKAPGAGVRARGPSERRLVEPAGLEPAASELQIRCSPN